MRDKFTKALLVLAALASFSVGALQAQTFGEVTGRVTDPSGAVVPAASLTLTNVNTNATRSTVTTDSGTYSFPSVPPGPYRLTTEVAGFKGWTSDFQLSVQQVVRLDVTLQVGQTSEVVEVAANAVMLQSETAALGTVIENKTITELPLNGRNYLGLAGLTPNANTNSPSAGQAGSRQGGDRAQQAISTGGQRIMFTHYTLDGVTNTDPNFNTYVTLPSIDAIQEFKVQLGVFPAEFGHSSTQVNVLTKSGGNTYHGSLFEFLRNDNLDARPYQFTSAGKVDKAPFLWNDYGFVLGGPVRIPGLFNGRDKLFFMSNYEAFRLRQRNLAINSLPTPAMFNGDFSALGETIWDPLTGQPFPGNVIPASRFNPISQQLLQFYRPSTLPGLNNNFQEFRAAPQNRDGFVLRLDFIESDRSQWMGRYNWGDENQLNPGLMGAGTSVLTNYEQYVGSNTRTFSPTLVNEARLGFNRFTNSVGTALAFNRDVVSEIGIPGLSGGEPVTWGIPNVGFTGSGFSGIGDSNEGPFAIDDTTLQFFDKLSWVRGSHTFSFGFEYSRENFNQIGNQFSRGLFEFQANATRGPGGTGGNAFAEFLLGLPFQSTVAVNIAEAKFQRNILHAFVDDTWKVTPKLTLSLGLRYERTPPFYNQLDNLFTVRIPNIRFDVAPLPAADQAFFVRQEGCTDPYEGLSLRWTQTNAVCGGLGKNVLQTQNNNFAPRVGIAYAFDNKTVIRAGFGMFYVQDIANAVYFDMARNSAARVTLRNGDPGVGRLLWDNAIPGGSGAIAQIPPPYAFAAAFSHDTSYTMQYLLNVQRQLGQSWSVELGYLGSISRHLYGFQDANQAIPSASPAGLQSRRPHTGFGTIQLVADGFNADYNAGSVKVTRRFSQGLSLNSNYTWSHSFDNSSGIRNQGFDQLFPQDSRCLPCERGPSAFDVRQRFAVGVTYELPVGRGKFLNINNPISNAIAGGWQLVSGLTMQSGVPQSINAGFDVANIGTPQNARPNFTGAPLVVDNPTPARWFNPDAFTVPDAGTFGNVGRNAVTTPRFQAIDAALSKRFNMPYSEGHHVQFRLEAFNVFNHPVWGAPNGNIRSGAVFPGAPANAARQNFGTINNTRIAMRQIQLGLKYVF